MKRRLPPLNAMRVFEAAARHLSFTRAADELHVTQAAVSHQVKALEEWLGTPLFQRLVRGLQLTDAGRRYLPRLTQAFDSLADATAQLTSVTGKKVLTLSTLDSFAALWLLPRLKNFRSRHPDIDVRVLSLDREADPLTRGDIDIDLRYGDGNWPGLNVTQILTEDIFPVCSPALLQGAHPLLTPQDLKYHTLLHDVMLADWGMWLDAAGVEDVNTDHGPGFNHSFLVTQAAINGDGVALGRSILVIDALESGKLVKPFELSLPSEFAYFFVCSKSSAHEPSVIAFRDWLLEEAAIVRDKQQAGRVGTQIL